MKTPVILSTLHSATFNLNPCPSLLVKANGEVLGQLVVLLNVSLMEDQVSCDLKDNYCPNINLLLNISKF